MKIAFFGHDAGEVMVQRRIRGMQALGHEVVGGTMRRGEDEPRFWGNIDLGRTHDGKLAQRLRSVYKAKHNCQLFDEIRDAELFWARNLDMLAVAQKARESLKPSVPIVYECLDVHWTLTGSGPVSMAMRTVEHHLLRDVSLIVTSSPAFELEHFQKRYRSLPPFHTIENRVPLQNMPSRPQAKKQHSGPVSIGWVGSLRCQQSLDLMAFLAGHFDDQIQIQIFGKPTEQLGPAILSTAAKYPNLTFHGAYQNPDDLPGIYTSLDAVWAGDYLMPKGNSLWALGNRLYEGGYFGVPAIVPANTAMADWVTKHKTGIVANHPVKEGLIAAVERLLEPTFRADLQQQVLAVPDHVFAAGYDDLAAALDKARIR